MDHSYDTGENRGGNDEIGSPSDQDVMISKAKSAVVDNDQQAVLPHEEARNVQLAQDQSHANGRSGQGSDLAAAPNVEDEPQKAGDELVSLELPVSSIAKVLKAKLPASTQISKAAKESAAKAASVFVMFLSSTANDIARSSKRSTINGQDIIRALGDVGMPEFAEAVSEYLAAFKAANGKKQKAKKRTGPSNDSSEGGKRQRREDDSGAAAAFDEDEG